jgi:rare lipoprotein A
VSGAPSAPAAVARGTYKVGSPYQISGVWYYPAEDWSYDETGIASWYGEDFHGKYTANGEVFDLNSLTAAHRTLPLPSIVEVTNLENGRSLRLRVNDRGPFARSRILDVSRRGAQLLGFEGNGTARVRVRIMVPETIQVASLARRQGDAEKPADSPQAAPRDQVAAEALPVPAGVRVASAQTQTQAPAAPLLPRPTALPAPLEAPPLPEKVTIVPVRPTQIFIQAGAFSRVDNAQRLKSRLDRLGVVKVAGARVNGAEVYRVRLGPVANADEADRLLNRVVDSGVPEARVVVE